MSIDKLAVYLIIILQGVYRWSEILMCWITSQSNAKSLIHKRLIQNVQTAQDAFKDIVFI